MSQTVEIVSNLRPIIFGLKVRTRGPQPSICVRTFSLFTSSTCRCPFRFPSTSSLLVTHRRERYAPAYPRCVFRCRRFRDAATGVGLHRWKLGFNQCWLHHAYRTCGTSLFIPSGTSAFRPCWFPLWVSPPSKAVSLRSSCSQPHFPVERISETPKRRTKASHTCTLFPAEAIRCPLGNQSTISTPLG